MWLPALSLVAVAGVLFCALLGLELVGYRLGRRRLAREGAESRAGLGVVEGAVFALLGLLLAFQFAGAAGRLDARRGLTVREANAIGTAYLRLDLLPEEEARPLRALFRQYLETRIGAVEAMPDLRQVEEQYRAGERLQRRIWSGAIVAGKRGPPQIALALLPVLNEMIDLATERRAAQQTHAPLSLQGFLIVLAMIGATMAGDALASAPHWPRLHMTLFAAVVAITIYFILDMEFPRIGTIRIGAVDQPFYQLRESMR